VSFDLASGEWLTVVASVSLGFLLFGIGLCFLRLRRGPTLADRVLALDLMTTLLMGALGAYVVFSRQEVFFDVVMVLALIAFLGTVIYARHIDRDARREDSARSTLGRSREET
jgi:multicomponent Na+:H+ antiporter subunit F